MTSDRRRAVAAFGAGRFLDFLRETRDDEGAYDISLIRSLIPGVELETVELEAEPDLNTLFELATVVWDVDELLALSMFREAALGGSIESLTALGEGLNWIGNDKEAVFWLTRAVEAAGGNQVRLAGLLGESLMRAGDFDVKEVERLLKVGLEESVEFALPLAQIMIGQGRMLEAQEFLERAVGAGVYGAALLLGNILSEKPGGFDAAAAAYRLGIISGDGHSAHNLAVMLLESGDSARAREFHELAVLMGDPTPLEGLPD